MIVVDFDDTLYNTARFKDDLEKFLFQYGVGKEDFLSSYTAADRLRAQGAFDYTFERQLECLKEKGYVFSDGIIKDLDRVLENKELVFSDAVDFLLAIGQTRHHKILMTLGNHDFQKLKIASAGLSIYFDEVVILHGQKEVELGERYLAGEKELIFINDNLRENLVIKELFPDSLVVSKVNSSKYNIDQYKESGLPYFQTLTEIKEYVLNQAK